MSSKPGVWMPFYFGDYLSDTMHLTTEQHGAYLLLLMACWKLGGALPNDDEQLATITRLPIERWRKLRPVIQKFWSVTQRTWTQKRLSLELSSALRRKRSATENGAKGGRPRKPDANLTLNLNETGTKPDGQANDNPTESSSPSPSPSPLSSASPSPSTSSSQKGKSNALRAALPDWLPTEQWEAFVEMRQRIRAPLTERAKILAIGTLGKLVADGQDVKAVIEQSVERSWRGLFAVKTNGGGAGRNRAATQEWLARGGRR